MPSSLRELLRAGIVGLEAAGVEEPRLDAELLLGQALGLSRSQLLARLNEPASPPVEQTFATLLARRARREPTAYLLGEREFFGRLFRVDRRVLIPRPETEHLVEAALEVLEGFLEVGGEEPNPPTPFPTREGGVVIDPGSPFPRGVVIDHDPPFPRGVVIDPGSPFPRGVVVDHDPPFPRREGGRGVRFSAAPKVADVGTGSGAIAVTLAAERPEARIYAVDRSAGALALAAENARRHGIGERVVFLEGHLLNPLPEPVDVVVANLPYIPSNEIAHLQPEVAGYEPRAALDGGPTGLGLIRELLDDAPSRLRPGGAVLLEIGLGQCDAVVRLAQARFPAARVRILKDLAGVDRVVVVETGRRGDTETRRGLPVPASPCPPVGTGPAWYNWTPVQAIAKWPPVYRVRQLWAGAFGRIRAEDRPLIEGLLGPELARLFYEMRSPLQRHCLDVCQRLRARDKLDPELLAAALLHDAGKGRSSLIERSLVVLLRAAAPRLFDRLARQSNGWFRAASVEVEHAARGAELARRAGASAAVVDLIRRHHQRPPDDRRLALLQAADDE